MTRTTACRLAVLVAVALACLPASMAAIARAQSKIDVTGTWAFEVQTEAGTGTPQVTFKQDGEKLTGVYSSQVLGQLELTGSVKGQAIQFTLAANVQGNALEVVFSGTVDDSASMKGTVTFTGVGEGSFTGKRK
jgi:streptogramin lyase